MPPNMNNSSLSLQRINLYTDDYKPSQEPLMAMQLVLISGVFLIFLTLISLWQLQQRSVLQSQTDQLQSELALIEQRLQQLRSQELLSQGPRLDQEIEQLQQQVSKRQQIKSLINNQNLGNAGGFSAQLTAMAQQSVADLSLAAFSLQDGGAYFEMSGEVKTADAVPRYLQQLRADPAFFSTRLGVLTVERGEQSHGDLYFTIRQPELGDKAQQALLPKPLTMLTSKIK